MDTIEWMAPASWALARHQAHARTSAHAAGPHWPALALTLAGMLLAAGADLIFTSG